jgi:N6-adenosine-specific RNA methylase IME4
MSVIDFDAIMDDGFVFLWVVNAKYTDAIVFMDSRGFKMIEQVNWLKINSKG